MCLTGSLEYTSSAMLVSCFVLTVSHYDLTTFWILCRSTSMPSANQGGGFPQQGGFPSFPQASGFPSMNLGSPAGQFPMMPSFPSTFPSQSSFPMPSFGQSLPQAGNQPLTSSQAQPMMMPQQMQSFPSANFQATMSNPLPFMPDNFGSMPMMGMPGMSSSFPSSGFPSAMPTSAPSDFNRTQSTPTTQVSSNGMPVWRKHNVPGLPIHSTYHEHGGFELLATIIFCFTCWLVSRYFFLP
jgi:hypothetical protein